MNVISTTSTSAGPEGGRAVAAAPLPDFEAGAVAGSRTGAQALLSSTTIAAAATTNQIDHAPTTEPRFK